MIGPIFGRAEELSRVFAFVEDDAAGARAIVISGEAGIGKTTIWRAGLQRAVELGLQALVAHPAQSEAGLPYAALADLFATLSDEALDLLPPKQRAAIGTALARIEHTGPLDQHALARGTLALLSAPTSSGPALVAIDDVQWLDGPTASALTFALRRLGSSSLCVLLSMRSEAGQPPDSLLGLESFEQPPRRVDVGPLEPTALGAILREALGEDLARPRVEMLARASGGNPMFALELARQPAAQAAASGSLRQTLAARIRELEPAGKTAVTIASAALQPSIDLLLEAGAEERGVRSAMDAGILVRDEDQLSFAHPLLASAAYELLLTGERREVHARLAAVSTRPIERAHHVSRSATGPSAAAAETLEEAARVAAELGDHAGAASFLLRAAELSPDPAGEAVGWRRARAAAELEAAGDVEAAADLARAVRDELPAGLPRVLARRTLVSAAIGATMLYEEALSELSLALADAGPDAVAAASIHVQLADMTMTMWRIAESRQHLEAAIRLGESAGAADVVTAALSETGFLDSMCGFGVTASGLHAYERWDGTLTAPNAYSPRLALGCARMHAGEFAAAAALLRDEIAAADARGMEIVEVLARNHLAEVQIRAGDWAAALADARVCDEHARQAANAQTSAAAAFPLAYVRALLGDHDGARAVALDGLGRTEAMRDVWYETSLRGVLGLIALAQDDAEGAITVLEPAWTRMQEAGIGNPSIFPVAHVLGEAHAAAGRLEDALAVAAALRAVPAATHPWCRAMAGRCEALVASAHGDDDGARAALDDALSAHAELPEPFERARTLHVQGRVERRARHWAAARSALTAALTEFDALGAARWAEKAAADLARLPGRRPTAAGELTPTESSVAALVAEGLSNKEVAARLFVSVRAVEANLSRIYAKLGIRSRAELARTFEPD
jgi:DNA-binding NarL/FixJ family response regulator/tetratricopeptide (TPR) repeat protein